MKPFNLNQLKTLFDHHVRGVIYKPTESYPSPGVMRAGLRYVHAYHHDIANSLKKVVEVLEKTDSFSDPMAGTE